MTSDSQSPLPGVPVQALMACRRCPAFKRDDEGYWCLVTGDTVPGDTLTKPDSCPLRDRVTFLVELAGGQLFMGLIKDDGLVLKRVEPEDSGDGPPRGA